MFLSYADLLDLEEKKKRSLDRKKKLAFLWEMVSDPVGSVVTRQKGKTKVPSVPLFFSLSLSLSPSISYSDAQT